jgi:hypothetical protein
MNKSLLLFLLIVVLTAGAWFSWQKAGRKSTLEKLDLNFGVSDTSSVDRILIEPVSGLKADLVRMKEGGWMVNDKFKVAPVLMDVLLSTIRNIEMLRPLAKNEAATAIEGMEKRGRKVSVFVNGSPYKVYQLGDDAPGNKGTYIRLEDGDPYVAYLRGFNGFLSPRYDVDENEWRDRLLFDCKPEQIESVKIQYRRMPSESIAISLAGRKIRLEGTERFDTAAAAGLLSSFQKIYVERYLPYFPAKKADSLLRAGSEWSLELNAPENSSPEKIEFFITSDADRSLAYIPQRKEWLTIQNRLLYPIMQRRTALLMP